MEIIFDVSYLEIYADGGLGDMRNDTYLWENEGRIRQKYSNVRG